jgi:hypothetical protein
MDRIVKRRCNVVVRDLGDTGWHSEVIFRRGSLRAAGPPMGSKEGPASVARDTPGRRRWRTRGRNIIGTRGPNRVNEWPGALMGPRIPNLEADLGHSGGVDFQQAQSGDVKAEGSALCHHEFRRLAGSRRPRLVAHPPRMFLHRRVRDPGRLADRMPTLPGVESHVSIGAQKGPRIGVQKGPLCDGVERRAEVDFSTMRTGPSV